MKTKKYFRAFTLIELMVTLAVFMIVVGLAVPAMQSLIANNRSITLTNELVSSMYIARSEAVKRGVSVSVCPAGNQAFTSCGNNWSVGWLVFVNPDENTTFANNATETLIRAHAVSGQTAAVTTTPASSLITYTASGFAHANTTNLSINILQTGCTGNNGRNILIPFTGRPLLSNIGC
tara:strand:+ start:46262 stop:46795 length:534 start_codon:yes stop_codon:yes gene_type:complete